MQTDNFHTNILKAGKYFNRTQILHPVKANPAALESVENSIINKHISGRIIQLSSQLNAVFMG